MQNEKSKKFLSGALLTLMHQKPYDKINISQICSAAFLSRTAFYKHFSTKDELLIYQFRSTLSALYGSAPGGDRLSALAACLAENAGYVQVISDQRLIGMLLPELADMLEPGSSLKRDGIFNACYAYLSLSSAVYIAPRMRTEMLMSYWRDADGYEPRITSVSAEKLSPNAVLLSEALLAKLSGGTPLTRISVKNLTAFAGVNRSSFYRCFSDVHELFTHCLRMLIMENIAGRSIRSAEYIFSGALPETVLRELGLEGFVRLYTSVLNELTELPDDDVPREQIYMYRLRNACFAAKRAAALYTSYMHGAY